MNLFEIWARKRSRQVSELAASSFLNYLLDPEEDHGMGRWFTNKFLSDTGVFPGGLPEKAMVTVYPECSLGITIGRIDGLLSINIDGKTHLVGIEVKIHDSSSTNFSSEGIPQLSRYYEALRVTAEQLADNPIVNGPEDITIIYVVPAVSHKWPEMVSKCIENDGERSKELKNRLRIVPWKKIDRSERYAQLMARHPELEPRTSVSQMLGCLLLFSVEKSDPVIDPYVLHFVHSLRVAAEKDFLAPKPAGGLHATQAEYLIMLGEKGQKQVFDALCDAIGCPIRLTPQHTTIGVPYADRRGGSIFRLRTVTKYGEGYDVVGCVELEFPDSWEWSDIEPVFEAAFPDKQFVTITARKDKHADRQGKDDVKVVSIEKPPSKWEEDDVAKAREAFRLIYSRLDRLASLPNSGTNEGL